MSSRLAELDRLIQVSFVSRLRTGNSHFTCRLRHVPHPPNDLDRLAFDFSVDLGISEKSKEDV